MNKNKLPALEQLRLEAEARAVFEAQWNHFVKVTDIKVYIDDLDRIRNIIARFAGRTGFQPEIEEWLVEHECGWDRYRVGFKHERDAVEFKMRFC